MPASFHSELQAEDYSPRTRLARVEIDKNNQKSVMANASKAREQSASRDPPVQCDEDDLQEPAQAQANGTTAHTPSGDEKDRNDNEKSERVNTTEHSAMEEDGTKIEEGNECLDPAENNVVPDDDDDDSEDEGSNAESVAVDDWQDASASIAAGSIADASTRNNCVYVFIHNTRN